LAVALGCPSPDRMLAEMSPRELMDWEQYFAMKPLPVERVEYGLGLLTSVLANIHRDSKKQKNPFEIKDFVLDYRPKEEKQAEDKQKFEKQALLDVKKKQLETAFAKKAAELAKREKKGQKNG
jgi:hypothetical protein